MVHCTRVLIVDDNVGIRTTLFRLLSKRPELQVVGIAGTGEEACYLTATQTPDVVVMDVQMPGMGGVEATRWIHSHVPHTRVLGVSAADEAVVGFDMRRAGAVDFVSKMAGMGEIVEAVRAVAHDAGKSVADGA
ncbi:MAG TPA: response regulator transcription factor [Pirellulaceae bacterium]|jgi:two-component system invasion response regulator UvrY|nr:response regulator transcription factor [Pirellulaceae bacterium]